jgi:hypothetical protein
MKNIVFVIGLCVCLLPASLNAQNKDALEKIERARIAMISERLDLTPKQAEQFWPVYREYISKRREMQQELRETRNGVDPAQLSDEESKKVMAKALELKQKQLDLEKEYSERLTKVITSQQLIRLRHAEKDFQKELIRRIQSRQLNQVQREKLMQRREMLKERGNN